MTNRVLASGCFAAVIGAVIAATIPVAGQAPASSPKPAAAPLSVKFAEPMKAATKTAWGEPDLQGVWTSDAALGIPRERPDKFGNRDLLSDEEFAEARKADEQRRDAGV